MALSIDQRGASKLKSESDGPICGAIVEIKIQFGASLMARQTADGRGDGVHAKCITIKAEKAMFIQERGAIAPSSDDSNITIEI